MEEVAAAFGFRSWHDYLDALSHPRRRAQMQALAQTWKE